MTERGWLENADTVRFERRLLGPAARVTMADPQHAIYLQLELAVPPADAYAAWTEIDRLRRWFGDTNEADPCVGGRYRAENRDGSTFYVHDGEYLSLEPGRRVRMSFGVPNAPATGHAFSDEFIEARFEPAPHGTLMRFTNGWNGDPIGVDGVAAVRAAWTEWLGKLEKSLGGEEGEER